MNSEVFPNLEKYCVIMALACVCVLASFTAAQKVDNTLVTMNVCWKYPVEDIVSVGAVADRSNVYIVEEGGRITAMTLSTGTRLWSTELGGNVISNLVVAESNIYAVIRFGSQGSVNEKTRLRSLSTRTGITNLDMPFLTGVKVRLELSDGKIVGISTDGSVMAYDRSSGSLTWNRNYPNIIPGTAVVWKDKIAIATTDRKVILVSALDGDEIATIESGQPVSAIAFIDDDLVWGDERGNVVRYDLEKRSVYWKFRNGAKISGLSTSKQGILAASLDNFIYLVHPYYGSVRWKKRMPGRVSDVMVGNTSSVIVLTVGDPSAVLLNLENGKVAGQVSVGSDESFLGGPLIDDGKYIFLTNRHILLESDSPCSVN